MYFFNLPKTFGLILFFSLLSLLLLLYTHQHIEVALINSKIKRLLREKKELESRNQALKEALSELNPKRWYFYKKRAPYQNSKILHIHLPPRFE